VQRTSFSFQLEIKISMFHCSGRESDGILQGKKQGRKQPAIGGTGVREARVDFFAFDSAYLEKLRAGDPATQHHFASYFGKFLRIRLRARRLSPDKIDDLVQNTLLKVIVKVHQNAVRQPECFGSFVNSTCNNVLREYYRDSAKNQLSGDGSIEIADKVLNLDGLLASKEAARNVRRVLDELPERDRRILRSLFFEEKDKDEICEDFGVKRDYLRVLVLRAKDKFRVLYK
jgi:RNA polymerase sigma-70 factor, ECF subfamily